MFDDEPDNANIHQLAFNEVSRGHILLFYHTYILICNGVNGDNGEDVHDGNQATNDNDVQCPKTLAIILQDSTYLKQI